MADIVRNQRVPGPGDTAQNGVIEGPAPLVSSRAKALVGEVAVPGDKSISHRALILGALAVGQSRITGLLEGDDVMATADALRALGADIVREDTGEWRIQGVGIGGFAEPDRALDLGNAGTGVRLLMGAVASQPVTTFFTGDASLRSRPMGRIAAPLKQIGARIIARSGCRLPLAVVGTESPLPIVYRLPVASAQVKSAVLLAGLGAPGETQVIEPEPTRDHTERMLRHFGAMLHVEASPAGERSITLTGQPELCGTALEVPGDFSSAAFPLAAALLTPGSELTLRNIGINPLRTGLLATIQSMGADVTLADRRERHGEPVADIVVRGSKLKGTDVPAERAPSMIDEYPILAVLAACAGGTTRLRGLAELRLKESDRLAAIARGLAAAGVAVEIDADDLVIEGSPGGPKGGASVETRLDHRIAMAFLVLGLVAKAPITIDDSGPIATSFPGFVNLMNGLGAAIRHA